MVSRRPGPTDRAPPADRGQSYVLEAIGAGIIVLSAVVFAVQATAVTPLSASTASQHIENQQQATAATLLDQAAANGTLQAAMRNWSADERRFHSASAEGYHVGDPPDNPFGRQLDRVFSEGRVATNVYVAYTTPAGERATPYLYQGTPSDNAVVASRQVVLTDGMNLTAPGETQRTLNATNATSSFYAPDAMSNGSVYNTVEVRIVVWRM